MLGNLKIAFLLQHTVSDWCIFTDALEALVAGLDDFAKFVRFRIKDAAFVLAYRVVLLEILGNQVGSGCRPFGDDFRAFVVSRHGEVDKFDLC